MTVDHAVAVDRADRVVAAVVVVVVLCLSGELCAAARFEVEPMVKSPYTLMSSIACQGSVKENHCYIS